MYAAVSVVTLLTGRPSVCVGVGVAHAAVAVVVSGIGAVALLRSGMNARVAVIAVAVRSHISRGGLAGLGRVRRYTVAVAVAVLVERLARALVRLSVTVVVALIADFRGLGERLCALVVAVRGVGDVTGRGVAGVRERICVTEAVAVGVGIPRLADVLIRLSITVVVEPVADLRGRRVGRGIGVVAVGGVRDVSGGLAAGLDRGGGVAVAVAVAVAIEGDAHPLVHLAVAVVVEPVADLLRGWADGRVSVVAVGGRGVAVAVFIERGGDGAGVDVGLVGVSASDEEQSQNQS